MIVKLFKFLSSKEAAEACPSLHNHNVILLEITCTVSYDFMKYTALLNVLISSVLLSLW